MDPKQMAQLIGNVLGASEMLIKPYVDAMRVIESVLRDPERYAANFDADEPIRPTRVFRSNCF